MEVPWWPIVSVLFILWGDANICNKVEASILPQYSNSQHNNNENESVKIASESVIHFGNTNEFTRRLAQPQRQGVIKQTSSSAYTEDRSRSPITSNLNLGLPVSQQQSLAVQENVSRQQKPTVISSTLASANHPPPKSIILSFPLVVSTNRPSMQESTVQQNSLVSSTIIANKLENPIVLKSNAQQQSKVCSDLRSNQNLLSSQAYFQDSDVVSTPTLNQVYLQEIIPQEQTSLKSTYQYLPKNKLKQNSNLPMSPLNSQGEASISSTVSHSNSISSQNVPSFPQIASLQKVSQQSNVALSSFPSNVQIPVTSNNMLGNFNRNSISSSATQSGIEENVLNKPTMVVSTVKSDITAQNIPNRKSGFESTPTCGRASSQVLLQEYAPQQQSTTNKVCVQNSQFPATVQESVPENTKSSNQGLFSSTALLSGSPSYILPWPQEPVYQTQDFSSRGLNQFPLIHSNLQSQIDTAVTLPLSNTQETITPNLNQISTEINTVSSNLRASPINGQQIITKAQQQAAKSVTPNANFIPSMAPNTVVNNNVELTSNILTARQEIDSISGLQSRGTSGTFTSSNLLNPNTGSVDSISSQFNSVESDFLSNGNAAPLLTTNLKASAASKPFSSNLPLNSYNFPRVINPFLENLQYPVISQSATLPSMVIQPVWFSNHNPCLNNLPVTNFDTNCVKQSETTDGLQSSFNRVNLIQQISAVNNIANEDLLQSELNSISGTKQTQYLLPESKTTLLNPITNYPYQTSVQSDVLSSDASINSIQSSPQIDEFVIPKTSVDPIENVVDINSSVHASQDISSGLLTKESAASVSSKVSSSKETILESTDNSASVNFNVNNTPAELTSPTITLLAPAPTIPISITPVCSVTPSPSEAPAYSYPLIQPIIMEDTNTKTKNWLPVILASIIRDNSCSGYNGGYCNNLCNCGTQYRQFSSQTQLKNNLYTCCGKRGTSCNCSNRGKSNACIIVKVDSDDFDDKESVESNDINDSDLKESKDISGEEPEMSNESSDTSKSDLTESKDTSGKETERSDESVR